MALDLWNYTTGPFTDVFERFVGNGSVFYLIPLIVLTMGLYIKTKNTVVPSMFMLASGAMLGFGALSVGMTDMGTIFLIFAAIGLVPLFSGLIWSD
jgi:hypothetical protein